MKPVVKVLALVAVLGFLLLGSAVFVGACAVSHLRVNGSSLRSGVEANRAETHELVLDAAIPLRVEVDCGTIRVASTGGTSARLTARLRAFGSDKEEAEQRLARLAVAVAPNSVTGHENRDQSFTLFGVGGGEEIDLDLDLPEGTRLELHSGSGDVSVQGPLGATRAASDYGDVEVRGVRGVLIVKSSSGDLRASELECPSVSLDTSYGEVSLARIRAERIAVHTSSGSIEASELDGKETCITSDYGDIRLRELAGSVEARTSSGELALDAIRGSLRAHSDYGNVSAKGVFPRLELSSSSGSVRAEAFGGSAIGEGWELRSDYGDVGIVVPANLGFELEASTDYGEVHADLPGALGGGKGDETHKLHGAVGTGGRKLRLHTSSGDVEIRMR